MGSLPKNAVMLFEPITLASWPTSRKNYALSQKGNGTMLDNTMIVYLSDAGEAHHGALHEWPFLIVGGCGGRLTLPGNYIRMPDYGQSGHGTIGNLYTSFLNAYGDPINHFGDPDFSLEREGTSATRPHFVVDRLISTDDTDGITING
jgi:hypothetical protein